jgi:hypothetical protein
MGGTPFLGRLYIKQTEDGWPTEFGQISGLSNLDGKTAERSSGPEMEFVILKQARMLYERWYNLLGIYTRQTWSTMLAVGQQPRSRMESGGGGYLFWSIFSA